MSKDPVSFTGDPEVRELDSKIRQLVNSGSFDRITETIAEFVLRRVERARTANNRR